ncbi:MAG: hypothetical protein ABJN62_14655 [Halioglobus sp.]
MKPIKTLAKVLLLGGCLLLLTALLVMASAFAWLKYDNDNVKWALEEVISRVVQRELLIEQVHEIDLGEDTFLLASNVSLANPAWASTTPFARSDTLLLEINIPSLWQDGPIVIQRVEFSNAELNLLSHEIHPATWEFWPNQEDLKDDSSSDSPFPLVINDGRVSDAVVHYQDEDQDINIELSSLLIDQKADDGLIGLELSGSANGHPVNASGRIGPAEALVTGQNIEMDLVANIAQLKLQAIGNAVDLANAKGLAMEVNARAPRSRVLLDMLGMPEVRDGPFQLQARLEPKGGNFSVSAIGKLGDFDLSLKGSAKKPLDLDGVDAQLSVDGPSLAEAGAMFDVHDLADEPYVIKAHVRRDAELFELISGSALIGDSRLELSGKMPKFPDIDDWQLNLDSKNLNLALFETALGLEGIPDTPYQLSGQLKPSPDGIELLNLTLMGEKSRLSIAGTVGEAPSYYGTQLDAELAGDSVADMAPWIGLQAMPREAFALSGELAYNAEGWRLSKGKFSSASLSLGLSGEMNRLINAGKLDAQLNVSSDNPRTTLSAYGNETEWVPALPLAFSANISGTPESINIDSGNFNLGKHSGTLSGNLGNLQNLSQIQLSVAAAGPALEQLVPVELPLLQTPLEYQLSGELIVQASGLDTKSLTLKLPKQQLEATANASIDWTTETIISAEFSAKGQSSHKISSAIGRTPQALDMPLHLNATLHATQKSIVLDSIDLAIGPSDLAGRVELRPGDITAINAKLSSRKVDLRFLLPDLEKIEEEKQAEIKAGESFDVDDFTDELTKSELRERLIADTAINAQILNQYEGNLDYRVERIYLNDEASTTVDIMLRLNEGSLSSESFVWDGSYSSGSADFAVASINEALQAEINVQGERLPFLWLLAGEPTNEGDSIYRARFDSTGKDLRELASNLNGALMFRDEGGKLDNNDLDLLMGDLLGEILDRLNPATEVKPYTTVECNAGAITARNGVIEIIPGIILRSDKLDYVAAGGINLNNEAIDLAFSTRSRKGLGISAGRTLTNYIKLGGTLANPRLVLDAKGAAVSGGAAIATAGWSIVAESMWDRWVLTSGDQCMRLIKNARKDKDRNYEDLWRTAKNQN